MLCKNPWGDGVEVERERNFHENSSTWNRLGCNQSNPHALQNQTLNNKIIISLI